MRLVLVERPQLALVRAARRLDLDHVGAHLREQPAAPAPGLASEFDDAQIRERFVLAHGASSVPPAASSPNRYGSSGSLGGQSQPSS